MSDPSIEHSVDAVLIGTSAGGIEALLTLLPALPASFALPVAVCVHLPPDKPSLLMEIFSPRCRVAVKEAEDKERLQPGVVYFAPPDYHLMLDVGGVCALSSDDPVHYSRPSIDVLFESAVDAFGSRVLALLLTGASTDGAQGLSAIGAAGGVTVVQDPAEAAVPAMPRAAIERRAPSHVLSLTEMSALLGAAGATTAGSAP